MGKAGSNLRKTSVNLPVWMLESLDDLSKKKGMTVTEIILKYVEQGLAKNGYTSGIGDEVINPAVDTVEVPRIKKAG